MRSDDVVRYAQKQQERLRLQDWHFEIHTHQVQQLIDVDLENPYAHVDYNTTERTATIHIACRGPEELVKEHIRHEYVHVVLAEMCCKFEHVANQLSPQAREIVMGQWRNEVEKVVGVLAVALEEE